ncbi:MAG: hypothetical protein QF845_00015 [Candidatus Marinimicrobia bacterium]|jgi:hypothetical protein|nr:hypothetical protein [Candidatus Neomarinimicrobiota bacterium]MDP6788902.1 hypothetical protein [Candidatus Neomarinimicrobiota bacterium]MDP7072322.1 hypothetical protein [Candidatus Neomarinimicrobiota bacterium]
MMKAFIASLAMFGFLVGQDNPQIVRTSYLKAKQGHVAKLEKGLKDHTDRFHQSFDHTINTWQVVAGKRTGQYLRSTRHQGWADFDAYQDLPGDPEHWQRAVAPHVESLGGNEYWRFLPDYSYNPPQTTPKMFTVWFVQYKAGQWSKHRDAVLKIIQARKDNNSDHQSAAYAKAVGGKGRVYAFLIPMDGWSDLNPKKMSLFDMLEKTFGEGEGSNILGSRSEAVEKVESEVILFRPDLSTSEIE